MINIIDSTLEKDELEIFKCIVQAEADRRLGEAASLVSLDELEENYYGKEVGYARRYMNKKMLQYMKRGGAMIDLGAGSSWWKEQYFNLFDEVAVSEVHKFGLVDIGEKYPKTKLLYTSNGLIKEDVKYDVVISSSVIGYIYPIQAKYHLENAYNLLKKDGQLILTRVNAFNLKNVVRSKKIAIHHTASIEVAYTKNELFRMLEEQGFKDIKYFPLCFWLPIPAKYNQLLYKVLPDSILHLMEYILPFLRIHHMIVAKK